MKVDWGFWEVLIGITAVALATLTILLALASFLLYFWGRPWLEELVRRAVREETESRELELRGRLVGYVGYIFGRLRSVRSEFLDSAIDYSKRAYLLLPDSSDWKTTAMNNLAFYYSIRGRKSDADAAIQYAKALKEDYRSSRETQWLTTYASVVGTYYSNFYDPNRVLREAEQLMEELLERSDVPADTKESATRHLQKLRAAVRQPD